MKISQKLKLFLYRFFSSKFGKRALQLLAFNVKIKNLNGKDKQKNFPFLIAITVDTESGYVAENERRVWQREAPEAFQGYYYGIRNLLGIFDKNKIKTTFFLSTNCFSSTGKECGLIKKQLNSIIKKQHEMGLHMHPDSDLAIQKKLLKKFYATSAFFYDYREKLGLIIAAKELIEENLGKNAAKNLISFRWGNWALDTDGAKALNKAGFKVDSSATPGVKGHLHDTMKYDWSKVKTHYPWKLSIKNYQETNHNNSNIIEVPIATFDFFGLKLRVDPVYSFLMTKAFTVYYNEADRSKQPFVFIVITHSSEATNKNGDKTKALQDLDEFISYAKKFDDIKFVTIKDSIRLLKI